MGLKLLTFQLLLVSVLALDLQTLQQLCLTPPVQPRHTLSEKSNLPSVYKVSGVLTNWHLSSLSLLTESSSAETRTLVLQSRDQKPNRWITDVQKNTVRFIDGTKSECDGNSTAPELIPDLRFREILNNKTSSVAQIVKSVIDYSNNNNGYLTGGASEIVGGEETVIWYTCINGTNTSNPALIEVRFAGDNTVPPAVSQFSLPLIMSIRMAEFKSFNDTAPLSHISVEIDKFELPGNDEAFVPHGVVCSGENATKLPLKVPDEFSATLTYLDTAVESNEIYYSASQKLLILAGDSLDKRISLLNTTAPSGTKYLVHDFGYGYEYALSDTACISTSTLPNNTLDVLVLNSTVSLKYLTDILVDGSLNYTEYQVGQDNFNNLTASAYRAKSGSDVVEVLLDAQNGLIGVFVYQSGALKRSLYVTENPATPSLSFRTAHLADCFRQNSPVANSTWSLELDIGTLENVYKVGLTTVEQAIKSAINTTIAPFNSHRLTVFWSEGPSGKANALLRLSEKSTVQPAAVAGSERYASELSSADIFQRLNTSIGEKRFSIKLNDTAGKPIEWTFNPSTVSLYPQQSGSSFIGYSGGSMVVLAIFTFLFGVGIGAGGVLFVSQRRGITTLAYQVFE